MSQRIVCLVPSLTELLSDLGLDEQIVGITKFCVHPEHIYRGKPRIGGTKTVDVDKVRSLRPTLVIANKEENVQEQVIALEEDFEVLVTDISDLPSALAAITEIGRLTGTQDGANDLVTSISSAFDTLIPLPKNRDTLYLIWREPYMSVGGDTFIHDMLDRCGLRSVCDRSDRYPTVEIWEIEPPQLVLLSSEPFPFKEKHMIELQEVWPAADIKLVDGEYFSWYGSRLLHAPDYFRSLDF